MNRNRDKFPGLDDHRRFLRLLLIHGVVKARRGHGSRFDQARRIRDLVMLRKVAAETHATQGPGS